MLESRNRIKYTIFFSVALQPLWALAAISVS
jgi:hypothetical protein